MDPEVCSQEPDETETSIEEASIIRLLRIIVTEGAAVGKLGPAAGRDQEDDGAPNVTCEEAGCLLWDMSASRACAAVMLRNRALDAFEAVLTREAAALQRQQLQQQLLEQHVQEQQQQQQQQQQPDTDTVPSPQPALDPAGGLTSVPTAPPPDLRLVEVSLGALANLVAVRPREAAAALAGREELLGLLLASPAGPAAASGDGPQGSGGDDGGGTAGLDAKPRARVAQGTGDGAAAVGRAALGGGAGGGAAAVGAEGGAGGMDALGGGLLFVDDSRVLGELCRLGSLALRAEGGPRWLALLRAPAVLQRLLLVAASTLDPTLLARVLDLLVAILHAEGRLGPAAAAAAPVTPDGPARAGPRARAVLLRCGLVDLVRGVLREAVRLQAGEVGEDSDAIMVDGNEVAGGDEEDGMAAVPSYGVVETYGSSGCFSNGAGGDGSGSGGALAEAGACPGPAHGAEQQQQQQEVQRETQQQQKAGSPGVQGDGEPEGGDRSGGGEGGGLGPAEVAAVVGALAGGDGADGGGGGGSVSVLPLSDEAVDATLRLIEELVAAEAAAESEGQGSSPLPRVLSPGLLVLLLALLRCSDSTQVVEAIVSVLVDARPAELRAALQLILAAGQAGAAAAAAAAAAVHTALQPQPSTVAAAVAEQGTDAVAAAGVEDGAAEAAACFGRGALRGPTGGAAVAERLVELLRDTCCTRNLNTHHRQGNGVEQGLGNGMGGGGAMGAGSGDGGRGGKGEGEGEQGGEQLLQAGWYLLAAVLREMATAAGEAAEAEAEGQGEATEPAGEGEGEGEERAGTGGSVVPSASSSGSWGASTVRPGGADEGARKAGGVASAGAAAAGLQEVGVAPVGVMQLGVGWRRCWGRLGRVLLSMCGAPVGVGCVSYVRACCAAGLQLAELVGAGGAGAEGGGGGEGPGGGGGGWGGGVDGEAVSEAEVQQAVQGLMGRVEGAA